DHLDLRVVEVGPLQREAAGVVQSVRSAAEFVVVEVLGAQQVVAVPAVVEEDAGVGAGADLAGGRRVDLLRPSEVVEAQAAAVGQATALQALRALVAEPAEVDADVLEEAVLDLEEARLDVDLDAD